jgi:L-aspartate oxidase
MKSFTDLLVVGTGVAGATVALRAARDRSMAITVITGQRNPLESATRYAQGGIAARDGDPDALVADILAAADGIGSPQAARILASEGPRLVREVLIEEAGVRFDRAGGDFDYAFEAAHSQRRVMHAADATGDAIERGLIDALRALPNVTLLTNCTAIDLVVRGGAHRRCIGVHLLHDGQIASLAAASTVLATGGVGALFRQSTNPPCARGDGIAMADRAGAPIANAEYVQFHPTALAVSGCEQFLISESVRGEGARLLSYVDRVPFMERYAPEWKDLAPRDVVARAIYAQMALERAPHVWLDLASSMPADRIRERFPTIDAHCLAAGIDIATEPIPVSPAAHYSCGGIAVDEWGSTGIDGLYAVGEVSCTGLHGANRLASTSLLEGVVWGCRVASAIGAERESTPQPPLVIPAPAHEGWAPPREARTAKYLEIIREVMWRDVGVIRTRAGLRRAVDELSWMNTLAESLYRKSRITPDTIGLRNAARTALVIARAALANPTSRGCHVLRADDATAPTQRTLAEAEAIDE